MKHRVKLKISCIVISAAILCTLLSPAGLTAAEAAEDSTSPSVEVEDTVTPDAQNAEQHISTAEELQQYLGTAESVSLILDEDITLTEQMTIPSDAQITLSGATGTETITIDSAWTQRDGMFLVDGALTLSDIKIDGSSKTRLIHVKEGGALTIEDGSTLTKGSLRSMASMAENGTVRGAGIYNEGTVTMNGGRIISSINQSSVYGAGGGVYNSGTFTMNGGMISSNMATGGGGIYSTGSLIIHDGSVTLNTAELYNNELKAPEKYCGGGIFVAGGTFLLTGGTINKNVANNNAENISSSLIEGNPEGLALGCGGGVYVSNQGAVFRMEGGTITGNTAYGKALATATARNGGGVYVQGGTDEETGKIAGAFIMVGGEITKNTCQGSGAGVYVASQEYSVYSNGASGRSGYGIFPGAAGMWIGGFAVVSGNYVFSTSGNTDNDLYLPNGVTLHIGENFDADAQIRINAESSLADTVLADYSEEVQPNAADLAALQVAGARVAELKEDERSIVLSLKDLAQGCTLSLAEESYVYTGSAIQPEVTVTDEEGTALKQDTDYAVTYRSNTAAGTAVVTVEGRGDYKGTLEREFTIEQLDIAGGDSPVTVSESDLTKGTLSYIYDGKVHKPALSTIVLTDTARGTKLNYNDDYTVTYSSDTINPGTVTVTIAGIGNYTGTLRYTYRIKAKYEFTDVTNPADFWYDPVYWAAEKGITTGWSDGTFRPWNGCNRAAVVTFLWRTAGSPAPKKMATFKDMTGNSDFDQAISWAQEQGITTGWSDNTFRPWNTCNRAAIVTFMWRYKNQPLSSVSAAFKDMTGNSDFDKAISWASSNGIVTGWSDNTFRPWNTCNRAATVTFLYRLEK